MLPDDLERLIDPDSMLRNRHLQETRSLVLGYLVGERFLQAGVEILRVANDRSAESLPVLRPWLQTIRHGFQLRDPLAQRTRLQRRGL